MASPLQHPPGPIGLPLVGVLLKFRRNPAEYLCQVAAEYGDVAYFRLGMQKVYLLNRPDLIEEVLVTNQGNFTKSRMLQRARTLLGDGLLTAEGAVHVQQRRLAQPAFAQQRLVRYVDAMAALAVRTRERWKGGEVLNVDAEMMRLTLSIVANALFGKDAEDQAQGVGQALTDVMGTFGVMLMPGAGLWRHLPLPVMQRAKRAQQYLNSIIDAMIVERRTSGEDRGDLLSMLLAAEAESERMTDAQVRDHALTFLLAGHETTATALTWTWYLLAKNPDADRRMREEITHVLEGRSPGYADVARLPYTSRVFSEALRLYPPAWAIGRQARSMMRLYNYPIPSGAICILSPYVMHRHPRYWPEPDRFDPDRFEPEAVAARPRFAYFPFGGGTRSCIGDRFAMLEGVVLLATIAQKWRLRLEPGHAVQIHPQVTLRPRHGMRMIPETT